MATVSHRQNNGIIRYRNYAHWCVFEWYPSQITYKIHFQSDVLTNEGYSSILHLSRRHVCMLERPCRSVNIRLDVIRGEQRLVFS